MKEKAQQREEKAKIAAEKARLKAEKKKLRCAPRACRPPSFEHVLRHMQGLERTLAAMPAL